ncbi:hypothetical protein BSL78_09817 [Apostichopus japonicus]|uniref:Uncharacterized protein n=1 Tax=Stichopus japonicus TaxID=307972 RepID=A0A2G8KZ60_STIJA|nr:hypothetical protein BSL78_09817 [Apostichopus japonicus]
MKVDDINIIESLCSDRLKFWSDDSQLQQNCTLQLLKNASNNDIPIFHLELLQSFSKADAGNIILCSGLQLSCPVSLKKLSIDTYEEGRELTETEVVGILMFAQQSKRMEELIHIKKVNLLVKVIRGEFDGAVERIDVIDEGEQAILITGPNDEDVLIVAPPDKGTAGSCTEHAFFKARHKQAYIGRSHLGSHGSPVSLKVMLVHELEVVFGENLLHENFDVRDGWTRVDLFRQGCTRGCDTFSMTDVGVKSGEVESTEDGCTGDLVLDIFKFPEEIWSVMDIRINLRNKRFDELVHKQGYLLGGGPIA